MNYKMLIPTYRERFRSLLSMLDMMREQNLIDGKGIFLNLGCGEGDFDKSILGYFSNGIGCDISVGDIMYCHESSRREPLAYVVSDAHSLPYASASFDCVVCIDVIEHTAKPDIVMQEAWRVLKPNGYAVFSFPRHNFPFFYDPINFTLRFFGAKISIGAYAYGHEKLIDDDQFLTWAARAGFEEKSRRFLSKTVIGIIECYWPGILQGMLKPNASNNGRAGRERFGLRPTSRVPRLTWLTDRVIDIDSLVFRLSSASIGGMFLLQKRHVT